MKSKSPQEKKALSYAKDRRNDYRANDKASRKSIPKRKSGVNRVYRRKVNEILEQIGPVIDAAAANDIDSATKNIVRPFWKKAPDAPLGEVVEEKLERRVVRAGRGKTARKAESEFVRTLRIEVEKNGSKWMARAADYPHLVAYADEKARAEEKLRHIAEVAKRNDLGSEIRVQIDGEFITPRLSL